jgi:hypothetical protein
VSAEAIERARELIVFADGVEEAGLPQYASRARMVAHDALELAEQLDAERSARQALQARLERTERLLLARGLEPEPELGKPRTGTVGADPEPEL